MLSFLREDDKPDGSPGPLLVRRILAVESFATAITTGVLAMVAIIKFIDLNPETTMDWKSFVPLFIPCVAFLLGGLLLCLFTTWSDVSSTIKAVKDLKR
jgi:hypothetical protein